MKVLQIELPEALADEVDLAVRSGFFADDGEVVREALRLLISKGRYALQEQHQLQDIEWAVTEARLSA